MLVVLPLQSSPLPEWPQSGPNIPVRAHSQTCTASRCAPQRKKIHICLLFLAWGEYVGCSLWTFSPLIPCKYTFISLHVAVVWLFYIYLFIHFLSDGHFDFFQHLFFLLWTICYKHYCTNLLSINWVVESLGQQGRWMEEQAQLPPPRPLRGTLQPAVQRRSSVTRISPALGMVKILVTANRIV